MIVAEPESKHQARAHMKALKNKIAMITGATGGLGETVTTAFQDAGATVAAVARTIKPNVGDLTVAADLSVPEEAQRAAEEILQRVGRIDVLAHLVGGFSGGRPVPETDYTTWRQMISLNLDTAFNVMRVVLPHMLGRQTGRIIAIGSRTGVEPVAGLSAYGVSKAGLIAFIRTLAAEVKDSGITANIVLPSVIDTPANRVANPSADFSRWVKPSAIAEVLVWLASDNAAAINGAVIPVYGRA
jgi:NAD(P)-dependent dehydrogenase (short-subunit alcohol dehydrogenase family)